MKIYLGLLTFIATVVAGINIGSRVPPDTIAMTIGVALGALTTIPISLILGAVIARRAQPLADDAGYTVAPVVNQPPYPRFDAYPSSLRNVPPVVIVNPMAWQAGSQAAYQPAQLQAPPMVEGPRRFHIVGKEAL